MLGASKLYSLEIPGPGWRVVEDDASENAPDLILRGPQDDVIVMSYVLRDGELTIDAIVDERRHKLGTNLGTRPIGERRYFLDGKRYVVASLARYGEPRGAGKGAVVLTVHDSAIIEVVALTRRFESDQEQLQELVESFELTPDVAPTKDTGE